MKNEAWIPQVLLVDDKPENLVALQAILRNSGYRLLTAQSGEEALKIALREKLTVVLLDVMMPGMDGFEVARHLKALERTREVPILFLTAVATDLQQIDKAYDVGAVDYLIKPLDELVVRRRVHVFVDLVHQRELVAQQAIALREAERREADLKLAELRLASDRRYRKLVEGIDHAMGWTMDEDLRITFISQRASVILGYAPEKFLEPGFFAEHVHPKEREAVIQMFRQVLAGVGELAMNHRLITADGRTPWYHSVASAERVTGRRELELHGISVEVSELKHAEEEAKRLTHLREEFLAIVAHDLRTPLGSIRMGATLLAKTAESAAIPVVERTAERIIRSTDRMDRLISDLLDVALIQAGRLTVERELVDAESVVSESFELFKPLAAERDVQLRAESEKGLFLDADRDRLLQIISNLMSNALKFTPANGSVELRVAGSGAEARFSISDTGPGMSEEEMSRMWERYWQGRKEGEGLGLGLFIAQKLVDAHRGRIWAESDRDKGSTFYFTIPLAPPTSSGAPSAQ